MLHQRLHHRLQSLSHQQNPRTRRRTLLQTSRKLYPRRPHNSHLKSTMRLHAICHQVPRRHSARELRKSLRPKVRERITTRACKAYDTFGHHFTYLVREAITQQPNHVTSTLLPAPLRPLRQAPALARASLSPPLVERKSQFSPVRNLIAMRSLKNLARAPNAGTSLARNLIHVTTPNDEPRKSTKSSRSSLPSKPRHPSNHQ